MTKGSDLIVKQKVTCDIDFLVTSAGPNSSFKKLLSLSKYDFGSDDGDGQQGVMTYQDFEPLYNDGRWRQYQDTGNCSLMHAFI